MGRPRSRDEGVEDVRVPARVVYRAIVPTVVLVGVIPMDRLRGDLTPIATAAELVLGRWGVWLVAIGAFLAFASVSNAGILSSSRYPLAMSRDGLVPAALLLLILAAALAAGLRRDSSPVGFQTQPVQTGNLTVTVSATGNLEATNQVEVGTELSGIITREDYPNAAEGAVDRARGIALLVQRRLQLAHAAAV